MRDPYKLMIACGVSVLLFFLLPNPYAVLISFLVSSISVSIFYSANKTFNIYIFLVCLLLMLLFPANFVTLDTSTVYKIYEFTRSAKNIINIFGTIIVIGIPTIMVGATIASFVTLQFEEGITLAVKTLVVVGFVVAATYLFNYFGFDLFGWREAAMRLWERLENWFGGQISEYSLDMNDASFRMEQLFNMFPIIIALIGLGSAIVFAFVEDKKRTKIMKTFFKTEENQLNKPGNRSKGSQSIQFVILLSIFLVVILGLGLYYSPEQVLQYQNQLYFSIYSIIIAVICLLLALGIACYTKNSKQTILGILLGVAGLFMFFNLFNQSQTMSMLALENPNLIIESILGQIFFVAPMESLLFHVFLPSFILYLILRGKKKYDREEIKDELLKLEIKRDYLFRETQVYKNSKSKAAKKKLQQTQTELFNVQKNIKKLNRELEDPLYIQRKRSISTNNYIVYIVSIVIFNAIFSIFHWFNSGLPIDVFFNSGLFFMYLSAGCWLTYLSYRFGWVTSIIVHIFNNSFTLILLLIATGV